MVPLFFGSRIHVVVFLMKLSCNPARRSEEGNEGARRRLEQPLSGPQNARTNERMFLPRPPPDRKLNLLEVPCCVIQALWSAA